MSLTRQKFILFIGIFSLYAWTVCANDSVGVLLTGPEKAAVGEKVSFEVELVNRSGTVLSQLRVIDYFDKGLSHAVSSSPIEQAGTIVLAAGTSRRLTLEFQVTELGKQCHRVEVIDQSNKSVGSGTACVEVVPRNSPAAAQAVAGENLVPSTKSPQQQGPGPVRSEAKSSQPDSLSQPSSSAVLPRLGDGVLSPPPPQAGNFVEQSGSKSGAEQVMGSESPVGGYDKTQKESIPVPIAVPSGAVPSGDSEATATPSATMPNVASLSTSPPAGPAFQVALVGPSELSAGGVGEFVVAIKNVGTVTSGQTALEVTWDPFLTPLEASDGYKLDKNKANWSIPPVAVSETVRRQINVRGIAGTSETALSSGTRACVRTVLSGLPGGAMVADEKCVVIKSTEPRARSPEEAGVRLNLADLDDPVRVGSGTTLVCTILNGGNTPTGPLKLVIRLPDHGRLVGNPMPSRVRIDGREITFDGIESLPAGERSTFELVYSMPAGESGEATASIGGDKLDGSLETSCKTTFLPR
ncbi:hypothetical protein N9U65_00655 [Planctomycetaceae bacterium]|nr:hypothetical protein [Planctomycetaceae bacterium]